MDDFYINGIFNSLPLLETERLILRPFRVDDAEDVFEYSSDPEITRYLVWNSHQSIEDSKTFITGVINDYINGNCAPWAISLKDSGKIIGSVGFLSVYAEHYWCEIGYILSAKYRNRGYMAESLRRLFEFAFFEAGFQRIEAITFTENIKSQNVLTKAGMRYEGTLRSRIFAKEKFHDVKCFSILMNEFNL